MSHIINGSADNATNPNKTKLSLLFTIWNHTGQIPFKLPDTAVAYRSHFSGLETNSFDKMLGIEFAPLNIPLERRLQALCVCIFVSLVLFSGPVGTGVLILLSLSGTYFWIPLLYGVWYWLTRNASSRGGLRIPFPRRTAFDRFRRDYFPVSLVKTAELDPKEKYLLGYHPHGIIGQGLLNFTTDVTDFDVKFPGITPYVLGLPVLHRVPIFREFIGMGGLSDVSKENINYIFQKSGSAVIILIGGVKEVLDARPGSTTLVLKNRKGFVRMALKNGAHSVPTYTFGENELYKPLIDNGPGTRMRQFQLACQKYMAGGMPVLIRGRGLFNYTFGFMPARHPVTTVVGRPITVEKNENPSAEQVNALHERYMEELTALFEAHKDRYGYGDRSIEYANYG